MLAPPILHHKSDQRHYHVFVHGDIPNSPNRLIADISIDSLDDAVDIFADVASGFVQDPIDIEGREKIARTLMWTIINDQDPISINPTADISITVHVCYGCIQQSWN